jgi:hypothetical protein
MLRFSHQYENLKRSNKETRTGSPAPDVANLKVAGGTPPQNSPQVGVPTDLFLHLTKKIPGI